MATRESRFPIYLLYNKEQKFADGFKEPTCPIRSLTFALAQTSISLFHGQNSCPHNGASMSGRAHSEQPIHLAAHGKCPHR
jgi:hypothetical protein